MAQDLRAPLQPPLQRSRSSHRVVAGGNAIKHDQIAQHATSEIQENKQPQQRSPSDEAAAAFVRRTLCAHHLRTGTGDAAKGRTSPQPLEELLPPLTSSNEVDLQLYAIISIIIKDFVQSWYSRITPDHEFVDEVVQIIAHCTRELEQRLRRIDLISLLLDEIPALLDAHVKGKLLCYSKTKDVLTLLSLSIRSLCR